MNLFFVLVLGSLCGVQGEFLCRFHRNGQVYGRVVDIDVDNPRNVQLLEQSLLPVAKLLGLIKVDAPSEFDLVNELGMPVASVKECAQHESRLYLLRRGDIWMFPGVEVGHKEILAAENERNVSIKTVSLTPKIFSLSQLVTQEECEQLIEFLKPLMEEVGNTLLNVQPYYHPVLAAIQKRLVTFLRVPEELFLYSGGFDALLSPPQTASSKGSPIMTRRDFYLRSDYPNGTEELERGKNTILTVVIFLNTLRETEEGEMFFPLVSEQKKKLVKFNPDGSLAVTIDPKSRACRSEDGLLVTPKVGDALLFYHLTPDGLMNGKVDTSSLYQYCNNIKNERWTLAIRIPNKTWYDSQSSTMLAFTDKVFQLLFGTDFTKAVLLNGYGWDWHENPRGHFSHKIPDFVGEYFLQQL